LWVVAAVCAETGQAEAILAPNLNTDVMNAFLQEFSRALDPDVHAVLIWDGAGFHRGGKLRVPSNVSLVELPPYSPQLNPIENLWHYLRSHYWSNRGYADYEALMNAAIDDWRKAALLPELMKSVCLTHYLEAAVHARDHFLAILSHELRNPLAAFSAGLQLLKLTVDNPVVTGNSREMMERQLKQMTRLVDDLLDVSRILT